MTVNWHVVRSKPNKEEFLCEQLTANNIEAYLPLLRAAPVNPRARKVKPYFPGYVFIRADLSQIPPSALQWMPGAIGLVSFGGTPPVIPEELICALQKRLEQINAAGGETLNGLKRGDAVVIQSGAFAGYEAVFDESISGGERARVLLKFLQRQVKLELRAGALARKQKRG